MVTTAWSLLTAKWITRLCFSTSYLIAVLVVQYGVEEFELGLLPWECGFLRMVARETSCMLFPVLDVQLREHIAHLHQLVCTGVARVKSRPRKQAEEESTYRASEKDTGWQSYKMSLSFRNYSSSQFYCQAG